MYAVIETGGKQYQVNEGDVIFIEKLAAEADETVTFDKVVALGADDGLKVGTPYVDGAAVEAKVSRTARLRRSQSSHTSPRRVRRRSRVTDSLTLRSRSKLSRLDHDSCRVLRKQRTPQWL